MPRAIEPDSDERSRTVPIRDSMTRIPGYPRKLVIFKIPASSYWWVRYYANFKTVKRTTKTEIKRDAMEAAKRFYDDVNIRFHKMGDIELPEDVNPAAVVTFNQIAKMLVESETAKLERKQLTQTSFDNLQLRLNKLILPHFGLMDVQMLTVNEN